MDIATLLARGGVWYNIPGNDADEFINAMVDVIRVPASLQRDELKQACIRREASSPTAMGRGLAFPHPGTPMVPVAEDAFVALAYPRFPLNWKAPDGSPVRFVFLVCSATRSDHLSTLSALARVCGDEGFYAALRKEATLEVLSGLLRKKPGT